MKRVEAVRAEGSKRREQRERLGKRKTRNGEYIGKKGKGKREERSAGDRARKVDGVRSNKA